MKWKPIAEITQEHLDEVYGLLVGNTCNGPEHILTPSDPAADGYSCPADIIDEGCWTHFAEWSDIPGHSLCKFPQDNPD